MKRFTLHVRLTKGCNADCSYCSSFVAGAADRMRPDDFRAAVDWIVDRFVPAAGQGGPLAHISIEYIGGEILTVPFEELVTDVEYARSRFSERFGVVQDGVQSNLIASPRKALALDVLFNGRIGTSVDRKGTARTVGGDPDAYRRIRDTAVARITRRRGRPPGAIFVVDEEGLEHVHHELGQAEAEGHSLILRPVFAGGKVVEKASMDAMIATMIEAFDAWAMNSSIVVEPFTQLLRSRVSLLQTGAVPAVSSGCPFQRDCAAVSLNLEPNGDLYVCLDMADSAQYRLGNALSGEFDWAAWSHLRARKDNLGAECLSCPFLASCQGGCMSQALHETGDVYGRPELCALWKSLFRRIDSLVEDHGVEQVAHWAGQLAA